jgi:hypothetical protein
MDPLSDQAQRWPTMLQVRAIFSVIDVPERLSSVAFNSEERVY